MTYWVKGVAYCVFQDEYYCPVTSDKPTLKGLVKGAREVNNMVRQIKADGVGEVACLTKKGKKLFTQINSALT